MLKQVFYRQKMSPENAIQQSRLRYSFFDADKNEEEGAYLFQIIILSTGFI